MFVLVDELSGVVVNNGDKVRSFRGEEAILDSWHAGKTPQSSGRVYVKSPFRDGHTIGYYPSVYGLKIVEVPEIAVGAVVKSYDFPEDKTRYVVGVVNAVGPVMGLDADRYTIHVISVVRDNTVVSIDVTDDYFVYPPVNGTPKSTGGVCNGVELWK